MFEDILYDSCVERAEKLPLLPKPSLITGEGHGHFHGRNKIESCHVQKKKSKRKLTKIGRRNSRYGK